MRMEPTRSDPYSRNVIPAESAAAAPPEQPPCDGGIRVRYEVLEGRVAPGGVQSGDVEAVLDRHGHAVQRACGVATGGRFVGGDRLLQCGLAPELYDSVQRRVDGFDPREQQLGQLARGELPAAQRLRRIGRRLKQCLVHVSAVPQLVAMGTWSSVTHASLLSSHST